MTVAIARDRIGQFVRRSNPHGFRTGQWAQILMTAPSQDHDCWLVAYQDGETDVVPVDAPDGHYEFRSEPIAWPQ